MRALVTDTTIPEPDLVSDVVSDFASAARHWAHRPAIEHNGTATSYRDLAERVRVTAGRYRARHVAADESNCLIGALVSHTPAVAEHLLGILQAGGTYCPVDAALPATRQQALCAVLGLDRLFATADAPDHSTDLRIETLEGQPSDSNSALPHRLWGRSDSAYVLCTSGSTGSPKPVAISRHALAVTVSALRRLFALTPHDRVLQFASLGWDTCLEEILPALTAGATLVFDEAAHSGSFPRFVRMLAQRDVSVVDLPTAFWHELVLFLHEEQAALPGCVRLVVIGGERIDPTRLRQWRDLDVGDVQLLNTYGCTETTMITHAVQLAGPGTEHDIASCDAEAPLGYPLPHVRDHVTDEGELLVSGPSLATGYLGSPELTAASFPVADHGSGLTRWFHTGDMVTRGARRQLYAHGRVDEQVKVAGVRVHPVEVEVQCNTHPAVAGAVVMGERLLGRSALTAYIVAAEPITSAELKQYLRERLPIQFVPTKVTFVAALSYTATGKVDRAVTQRAATDGDSKGESQ